MRFKLVFIAWFTVALVAGALGLPAGLHPPFPQVLLLTLTGLVVAAGMFVPPFRHWLLTLTWQSIVAIHLTRFVGGYFIYLCRHGELSCAWALPAGIGDLVVAILALSLLLTRAANSRLWPLIVWNFIGLADILAVVGRAAFIALQNPASMAALLRLPLSLLVTFLVPIIIAGHLLVFARMRKGQRGDWPNPAMQ